MLYAACWVIFALKVLFVFFCFKQYFRMRRREREGREREGREREEREHAERERLENQVEEVEEEQEYNEMD
jgi:flagellar biosynthesis/type III secretory pathway M-ring protein FliF/YscJ